MKDFGLCVFWLYRMVESPGLSGQVNYLSYVFCCVRGLDTDLYMLLQYIARAHGICTNNNFALFLSTLLSVYTLTCSLRKSDKFIAQRSVILSQSLLNSRSIKRTHAFYN